MAALDTLIPELEHAIESGSPRQRARTLEQVTKLFLQSATHLTDEHVELFDDVLSRLVVEIETLALVQLSNNLAPIANAPLRLLRRLARDDDIAVAGPVLLTSTRISEIDLVDIAQSKSQAHLLAISSRQALTPAVTDVLVSRGDRDVARAVANNEKAMFSEIGYAGLVRRARDDGFLAEKIGQRPDVPPHLLRTLIAHASEVVRDKLLASTRPERQHEIRSIISKISHAMAQKAPQRDFGAAERATAALAAAGNLDESQLLGFAKAGMYEESIAALSALCHIPLDVVDRLVGGDRPDPILIMCKANGFDWATARAIMLLRPQGANVSPRAIQSAMDNFDRLAQSTAERVLRFWQARQSHRAAG